MTPMYMALIMREPPPDASCDLLALRARGFYCGAKTVEMLERERVTASNEQTSADVVSGALGKALEVLGPNVG